jgi:hypothetical protein
VQPQAPLEELPVMPEERGATPAANVGSRARALGLLQPRQHSYSLGDSEGEGVG